MRYLHGLSHLLMACHPERRQRPSLSAKADIKSDRYSVYTCPFPLSSKLFWIMPYAWTISVTTCLIRFCTTIRSRTHISSLGASLKNASSWL